MTERRENIGTQGDVMTAVTHNGKFHADEVFATAVLTTLYPELRVVRSRDTDVIEAADIVYDVGGMYDHERGRYDHHQKGALKRADGLTRSALGLIWLHYGEAYCGGDTRAADYIDRMFVRGIDARDNGELTVPHDVSTPDYGISRIIEQLNPILEKGETHDEQFTKAVGRAAEIVSRLRDTVLAELAAEDTILSALEASPDPRYVVLDHQVSPPDSLAHIEGFLYLVFPEHTNNSWQVCTIRTPEDPFVSKRPFPAAWAGLMNEELAELTGVEDAMFCHAKRFLAVARSREGALALLERSLQ